VLKEATHYRRNSRSTAIRGFRVLCVLLQGDSFPETMRDSPEKIASRALSMIQSTWSAGGSLDWSTYISMSNCSVDEGGRTILMKLIRQGLVSSVQLNGMRKFAGGDVRTLRDTDGNNLVHLASLSGSQQIVQWVLGLLGPEGLNAMKAVNKSGLTARDIAIASGRPDVVDALQRQFHLYSVEQELLRDHLFVDDTQQSTPALHVKSSKPTVVTPSLRGILPQPPPKVVEVVEPSSQFSDGESVGGEAAIDIRNAEHNSENNSENSENSENNSENNSAKVAPVKSVLTAEGSVDSRLQSVRPINDDASSRFSENERDNVASAIASRLDDKIDDKIDEVKSVVDNSDDDSVASKIGSKLSEEMSANQHDNVASAIASRLDDKIDDKIDEVKSVVDNSDDDSVASKIGSKLSEEMSANQHDNVASAIASRLDDKIDDKIDDVKSAADNSDDSVASKIGSEILDDAVQFDAGRVAATDQHIKPHDHGENDSGAVKSESNLDSKVNQANGTIHVVAVEKEKEKEKGFVEKIKGFFGM